MVAALHGGTALWFETRLRGRGLSDGAGARPCRVHRQRRAAARLRQNLTGDVRRACLRARHLDQDRRGHRPSPTCPTPHATSAAKDGCGPETLVGLDASPPFATALSRDLAALLGRGS